MRPFEWYTLNLYHVMKSWGKLHFSRKTQKHVSEALTFNIAFKIYFFLVKKFGYSADIDDFGMMYGHFINAQEM